MVSLILLKEICRQDGLHYTGHAQEQMALRHIKHPEIVDVILGEKSEIIENYSDDKYSPSALIFGVTLAGRILHVQSNHQGVIITVYEPDPAKWHEGLKTRRR